MARKSLTEERIQKREFWKRHIEECRRRESSQVEYCRQHKLSTKSFTYWKRRFRQNASISFVPLQVQTEVQHTTGSSSLLMLLYKDEYRIEIKEDFKPAMLRAVLHTLRDI